jgi:hypothetical protein
MDALRLVTVADPAAGVNFTYTHPPNVISIVRNLRMRFQHDLNAGNRNIVISLFEPGGLLMSSVYFTAAVTLADTWNYFCLQSECDTAQSFMLFGGPYLSRAECPYFSLLPGWQLRSQVQGLFVGDQISEIRLLLEDLSLEAVGAVA